jgi:hypothetical protein
LYVCKPNVVYRLLAIRQYFIGCPGLPAGVQANYDDDDDDGDANDHGMVTRSMGREVLYLM